MCIRDRVNGEVTVIDESESEGKESLSEYSEQRANFPSGIVGVKTPKLLFEDEGSSRVYVGDVWSPNDPLVFCVSVPGEARGCFYEIVVPYANIERENVAWCDKMCIRDRFNGDSRGGTPHAISNQSKRVQSVLQ